MRKIRVLIVDGEILSRRKIGRALESDGGVELVGACCFGSLALDKVGHLQPDLIVLGIVADAAAGIATLAMLREARPELPIVLASPLAQRGSPLSLEAISSGVSACVAYAEFGSPEELRSGLLPKLHSLLPMTGGFESASRQPADDPPARRQAGPIEAVVIGASTGGPNVLAAIVGSIPADFRVPILIVQHIPADFTRLIAERLSTSGPLPFREVQGGEGLGPGTAWVAPGGRHLKIERTPGGLRASLDDGPPENSCQPAVDVLFRSAATATGGRLLGVVLTGMGRDGLRGCRAIREAGGTVFVQDQASSVVWGMPGNVAEAGLAHKILPIAEIGPEIVRVAASRNGS